MRTHTLRVGGAIAFMVVGGLAAVWAGLCADARPTGRFARLSLETSSTAFDIVLATGILFPSIAVQQLSDGESAWERLIWIVVAFLGSTVLIGVPSKVRTRIASRHHPDTSRS